jgi:hypothetical protein
MGDQEYNSGKKYRQKGTLCGPNSNKTLLISCTYLVCIVSIHILYIHLLEDNVFQEELYL